ncbi:hypothetical protein [Streptomyces chartreusis]|uniref:hypothetical protein n=1 Tax=Streptomyces chartreusis TaxID=1969 RepID=UPI003401AAAC
MVVLGVDVEDHREHLGVGLLGCPGGQEIAVLLHVVRVGFDDSPCPQVIQHEPAILRVRPVPMGHHGGQGLEAAPLGEDP